MSKSSPILTILMSSFVLGRALLNVNFFNSDLVGIKDSTFKASPITLLASLSAALICSSVRTP